MNTAVAVRMDRTRGLTQFESLPVSNLATRSWVATIPIEEFARMAEVANEARVGADLKTQRELYPEHALKLARYIVKAMVTSALAAAEKDPNFAADIKASLTVIQRDLGEQPSFALQPFVVSIREQDRNELDVYKDGAFEVLQISSKAKLWVIDGQHRVYAIRAVSAFLDLVQNHNIYQPVPVGPTFSGFLYGDADQPRTAAEGQAWRMVQWQFSRCDVAVNIFTELGLAQERQLFHDLNNLGRSVESGLAFAFDQSNSVNKWIKSELIPKIIHSARVVNKDQKNWDEDGGQFVRKDLITVNAFLFLRKTSVSSAEPRHITPESTEVALRFWRQILAVPGMGRPGAKKAVVLAQPVVQKALALLVNHYGMPRHRKAAKSRPARDPATATKILDAIPKIDWTHANPLWRAWSYQKEHAKLRGIGPYLPADIEKAKGEFATFNSNRVRYGVKHNEIAPAIADLLRFELDLPATAKKTRKKKSTKR